MKLVYLLATESRRVEKPVVLNFLELFSTIQFIHLPDYCFEPFHQDVDPEHAFFLWKAFFFMFLYFFDPLFQKLSPVIAKSCKKVLLRPTLGTLFSKTAGWSFHINGSFDNTSL